MKFLSLYSYFSVITDGTIITTKFHIIIPKLEKTWKKHIIGAKKAYLPRQIAVLTVADSSE